MQRRREWHESLVKQTVVHCGISYVYMCTSLESGKLRSDIHDYARCGPPHDPVPGLIANVFIRANSDLQEIRVIPDERMASWVIHEPPPANVFGFVEGGKKQWPCFVGE